MKKRIVKTYGKKIIMIMFVSFFLTAELSGLKIIDITDVTVKVVGWIKAYKDIRPVRKARVAKHR